MRGKKLAISTVTLGLAIGGLTLGATGCGSSQQQQAAEKSCGGDGKSCGGEAKKEGEGEKSCGGEGHKCGADGKSCGG